MRKAFRTPELLPFSSEKNDGSTKTLNFQKSLARRGNLAEIHQIYYEI